MKIINQPLVGDILIDINLGEKDSGIADQQIWRTHQSGKFERKTILTESNSLDYIKMINAVIGNRPVREFD